MTPTEVPHNPPMTPPKLVSPSLEGCPKNKVGVWEAEHPRMKRGVWEAAASQQGVWGGGGSPLAKF